MKGKKTGGRVKGTPNKVSGALKDDILDALQAVGGVEYLREQATKNPNAFLSLLGRVLPMQVNGPGKDGEHTMQTVVRHIYETVAREQASS